MAGASRMTEPQIIDYNDVLPNFSPYDFIPAMDIKTEPYIPETAHGPYIQIIEEPKQRGFRFRYECEGPSHGGLPGASSEKNRRTYPTVKINNYVGHARVEVQLVTHTDPPRVHAHSLVGRHCNENGTCSSDIGPNDSTASFSNSGILHVTKKGVVEVSTRRSREERRRQKGAHCPLTDAEETSIMKEAKESGKIMDSNIVRLRFTAFSQDSNGGFTRASKPVVSNPIYDSKSPNASNSKISRMDKTCGSVSGGDEIFSSCDKVQKDDIEVRFYEEDDEGCWEAFGDFSPTDVHKQYAIVFKTPPYHSAEIDRPVTVFSQSRRKKAGDSSDPKQFTYIPQVQDKEEVMRKKSKPSPHYDSWRGGGRGSGSGTGGFGGGAGGPGFQFQQMNGGAGGGAFFGGFPGFGSGGGAQMSGSAPQTGVSQQQGEGQPASASQQQSLRIAASLSTRVSQSARQTAAASSQYCSTGDARVLSASQRHSCGIQDANGDTPLHSAIIHQQTAVIHQSIQTSLSSQQHAILNTANHSQQTPLHSAVITRQSKVAEVSSKAGADPTSVDKDGRSPLHSAASAGDTAALRLSSAHSGERYAHSVNTPDYHGSQPLHSAVRRDGERCSRSSVEGGAKINAPERKSGNTASHLAVRENSFKVACTLITESKADVNACTFGGNTALHSAASSGSPTLCSMSIAAGADKNMENDEPLFFSSSSDEDQDEPIRERGDNTRKRPGGGHTPSDSAVCQKVKNSSASRQSPKPSRHSDKKIRTSSSEDGERSDSDEDTSTRSVEVSSVGDVPWVKSAEKSGMMTSTQSYEDSPTPCQHSSQHYKSGGGPVEGSVEASQSSGSTEGVRSSTNSQLRDDKHSSDATVDSGFSSQPMEEQQQQEDESTNQ